MAAVARVLDQASHYDCHGSALLCRARVQLLRQGVPLVPGAAEPLAGQEMVLGDLDSVIHECICRLRTNTLQLNTENSKLHTVMDYGSACQL